MRVGWNMSVASYSRTSLVYRDPSPGGLSWGQVGQHFYYDLKHSIPTIIALHWTSVYRLLNCALC